MKQKRCATPARVGSTHFHAEIPIAEQPITENQIAEHQHARKIGSATLACKENAIGRNIFSAWIPEWAGGLVLFLDVSIIDLRAKK